MSAALLLDLQSAIAAGDSAGARGVAERALQALSPSGLLLGLAGRADLLSKLDGLSAEIDADLEALKHLDQESLVSRLEDDFARAAPTLAELAVPLENWAIPLLSQLAGPGAPLLSIGLLIACKVALAVLARWAAKRTAAAQAFAQAQGGSS